jgi:hypothetical protein
VLGKVPHQDTTSHVKAAWVCDAGSISDLAITPCNSYHSSLLDVGR